MAIQNGKIQQESTCKNNPLEKYKMLQKTYE